MAHSKVCKDGELLHRRNLEIPALAAGGQFSKSGPCLAIWVSIVLRCLVLTVCRMRSTPGLRQHLHCAGRQPRDEAGPLRFQHGGRTFTYGFETTYGFTPSVWAEPMPLNSPTCTHTLAENAAAWHQKTCCPPHRSPPSTPTRRRRVSGHEGCQKSHLVRARGKLCPDSLPRLKVLTHNVGLGPHGVYTRYLNIVDIFFQTPALKLVIS